MQPYNENQLPHHDEPPNTETNANIGTWILVCIILALINVILGLL